MCHFCHKYVGHWVTHGFVGETPGSLILLISPHWLSLGKGWEENNSVMWTSRFVTTLHLVTVELKCKAGHPREQMAFACNSSLHEPSFCFPSFASLQGHPAPAPDDFTFRGFHDAIHDQNQGRTKETFSHGLMEDKGGGVGRGTSRHFGLNKGRFRGWGGRESKRSVKTKSGWSVSSADERSSLCFAEIQCKMVSHNFKMTQEKSVDVSFGRINWSSSKIKLFPLWGWGDELSQ